MKIPLRILVLLISFSCLVSPSRAIPGHLLLIGGGSEKDSPDAWNRLPYTWAVEQSQNRRVALVAYGTASDWLPEYLVDQCGAVQAKNFNISSASLANAQATYDSLMSYDMIFLKGGDQYNYYNTYKGSLTEQAIVDKFQAGGVICGTSAGLAVLGGVDYIAAASSADPFDCLQNPVHPDITLADDFIPLLPAVLFDSHFAERGRFGRLIPFLANWWMEHDQVLLGIGVDDQTAFAIGSDGLGTAYGSGTVNLYLPDPGTPFLSLPGKLEAENLQLIQLAQGAVYDFNTGEVSGFSKPLKVRIDEENGNYTILASGGEELLDNQAMLEHLVRQTGNLQDPVLILTGTGTEQAEAFRAALLQAGATEVYIGQAILAFINQAELGTRITSCRKFLFVGNNEAELLGFLGLGSNGPALNARLRQPGTVSAFVGMNSRLPGRSMVENFMTEGAGYSGELDLSAGMALLPATAIMPLTWQDASWYENTTTGLPWAMIKDSLKYGIWLNPGNFMKYDPEAGYARLSGYGDLPVILLENTAAAGGLVTQTVYGDAGDNPRDIAGFDRMVLTLLQGSVQARLGEDLATAVPLPGKFPVKGLVYPNPFDNVLHYQGSISGRPVLTDLLGRVMKQGPLMIYSGSWFPGEIPPGIYLFSIHDNLHSTSFQQTIVRK